MTSSRRRFSSRRERFSSSSRAILSCNVFWSSAIARHAQSPLARAQSETAPVCVSRRTKPSSVGFIWKRGTGSCAVAVEATTAITANAMPANATTTLPVAEALPCLLLVMPTSNVTERRSHAGATGCQDRMSERDAGCAIETRFRCDIRVQLQLHFLPLDHRGRNLAWRLFARQPSERKTTVMRITAMPAVPAATQTRQMVVSKPSDKPEMPGFGGSHRSWGNT